MVQFNEINILYNRIIKLLSPVTISLFSFILFSCGGEKKDPTPKNITIFELEVDNSFSSRFADEWVIVSDNEGNIVTASTYTKGSSLTLEASAGKIKDKMTISFLSHNEATATQKESFFLYSYTDIPVGHKWVKSSLPSTTSLPTRTLKVKLNNTPNIATSIEFSSLSSSLRSLSGGGSSFSADYDATFISPISDFFICIVGYLEPRYLLANTSESNSYTFDVSTDFKSFDNVIPIDIVTSKFTVSIQGLPDQHSYETGYKSHIMSLYFSRNDGNLQVGYNEGYSNYSTSWSAVLSNGATFGYSRVGDPPSANDFSIEPVDFTVTNSGFNQFEYTNSSDFTWYQTKWYVENPSATTEPRILWEVNGPIDGSKAVITSVTGDLDAAFPVLNDLISELSYRDSKFTASKDGMTYEEYAKNIQALGTPSIKKSSSISLYK